MFSQKQKEETVRVVDLVTTNEHRKFEVAGRMAATIIQIIRVNGACLPKDLNARGFTPTAVIEHWDMAKLFAVVEMKLMNEILGIRKSLLRRK